MANLVQLPFIFIFTVKRVSSDESVILVFRFSVLGIHYIYRGVLTQLRLVLKLNFNCFE